MTEDRTDHESQQQSEVSEEQNESGTADSDRADGGQEATLALATEAASKYASENQYAYGPNWKDRELVWTATSCESLDDGTRVTLEYKPKGRFRGTPGVESIDIDPDGKVLRRNQIRTPGAEYTSRFWALVSVALLSAIVAGVLVPWILLHEDEGNPFHRAGRILEVIAPTPQLYDVVIFEQQTGDGEVTFWRIEPLGVDTQLAVVDVTVINRVSGTIRLIVDDMAAELRTRDSVIHKPINTIDRSEAVEIPEGVSVIADFVPLWLTVNLESKQQISGKMVFEVQRGSEFRDFRWLGTDTVFIRY